MACGFQTGILSSVNIVLLYTYEFQ